MKQEDLIYRQFRLQIGEESKGAFSEVQFQWAPKMLTYAPQYQLKEEMMRYAETAVDLFLEEVKKGR